MLIIPSALVWNLAALSLIAAVYFWQKAAARSEPPAQPPVTPVPS
jgi:hypothetical protein